jgi:GAF domain-containing protein
VLRHESSSSSADDRRVIAAEFRTEPRRFERAITFARIGGAVASLIVAPLIPNLGFGYVLLLSTYLVVWGVGLHLLSERASTAADQDRISMASFVGDCVVLFLAMLTLTPDPNWTLFPVMGVLFIITAAFRLGGVGALAATVILSTEFIALALWREQSLGLTLQPPYLAFVLVMYCMTALLTSGMLREIGALRSERTVLIRDADSMRRAERDRGELLERERSARADAEVATARLEALQRITDAALARTSLEEMLPEMLQRILPVFTADAIVALVPSSTPDSYVVRAGIGVVPLTRAPLRIRGGDCERAIQSRRAVAIGDRSAAEIEAIVNTRVEASAVAPLVANGQHTGLLYIGRGEAQPFAQDELALLRLIADRVAGALERATLFDSERRARSAAEAAEGRMRLLLHAGDALVTPNIGERLGAIARIAVPDLADFCAIDLLEENGDLERVALAAVDVEMERDNWALASRERREPTSTHPIWDVLRTGEPIVWEDLDPPRLNRLAWSPQHLRMMLERGVHSWMAVPLRTDRIRGALVFVNARSERRFDQDDLATAQELARRVAAALTRA